MKQNRILIVLGFIFLAWQLHAQQAKEILSPERLMEMVRRYHPIAKQAALLVNRASADVLSARGGFDPVLEMDASRKTFDGKNYYYYTNPELQIPTAAAFIIKTGIESNGGDYLSSEVTKGRSSYLGIELPLGNGLLIDKRRAALQQAFILKNNSEQERRSIINNLLLDAYTDYWQWAGAYQLYKIYGGFVENAENRFRLVKNGFIHGDRAAMDTLESFTQVQQYQLFRSEAFLKLTNAAIELGNYLWLTNDSAYLLPINTIPDTTRFSTMNSLPVLEALIVHSMNDNPLIKSAAFKVASMETDRRLKFQGLLPYLSVKANVLNYDYQVFKGWESGYIQNNYKWGIGFNMPLFLRQGRGEYKKAQIKVKESQLELVGKKWQTENKIRYYFNENSQLLQQLQLVNQMRTNYYTLLRNEELKFQQGESSLFLINTRENKVLDLLQKQTELLVKYQTVNYKLNWAVGSLQ